MFRKQRRVRESGITTFCSVVSIIDTFSSFRLGLDFDTAEENKRGSASSSSPSPTASLSTGMPPTCWAGCKQRSRTLDPARDGQSEVALCWLH